MIEAQSFGLPGGAVAPDFELPNLAGGFSSLSHWKGHPVVLIFIQPGCPISLAILPALAELAAEPPQGCPVPVIITMGHEGKNRRLVRQYGIRCTVLVQDDVELVGPYRVWGTPASCLIDEHGRVVRRAGQGAAAVLSDAGLTSCDRLAGNEWATRTTAFDSAGAWLARLLKLLDAKERAQTNQPATLDTQSRQSERTNLALLSDGPIVTVVMATRDRPRLLEIALECFRRQTYARRELIVVDDGNKFPADTEQVAAAGGHIIRVDEGTPLGTKINLGVSAASSELALKWDDDDWYGPLFLETMVSAFVRESAALGGRAIAYMTRTLWLDLARWQLADCSDDSPAGGTILFSRQDWERRPFRNIRTCEDFWFLIDQLDAGAAVIPVITKGQYLYVRHDNSTGEREHSWLLWWTGERMQNHLRDQSSEGGDPSAVLPGWALDRYQVIRSKPAAHSPNCTAWDAVAQSPIMARPTDNRPTLLYLTPVIPSTTGSGMAMRAENVLRSLASRYNVYLLVVLLWEQSGKSMLAEVDGLCQEWAIIRPGSRAKSPFVPIPSSDGWSTMRRAPNIWGFATDESLREVSSHFRRVSFDVVHAFRLCMAPYAEAYINSAMSGRPLWLLDLDDVESKTHRRLADLYRTRGKDALAARNDRESRRFAIMEAHILPRCDLIFVSSRSDGEELRAGYQYKHIHLLPNVVREPTRSNAGQTHGVYTFLFVGHMNHYPNEDAVLFLCYEVLPILRRMAAHDFGISIVCSGEISRELHRTALLPEVDLIGAVPDVSPWYERSDAVVVPVRAGGGTRIKVLEAMSYRRPVVSTSLGIEGLEIQPETHALVGDSAEAFAQQCLRLMGDTQLAERLTETALEFCRREHNVSAMDKALDDSMQRRAVAHALTSQMGRAQPPGNED